MDDNDFGNTDPSIPAFRAEEAENVDGGEDSNFGDDQVIEEAGPRNPEEKAVGVFIKVAYAFEGECRDHFETIRAKKSPRSEALSAFEDRVTRFADYVTGLTEQGLPAADVQEALDNNNAEVRLDGLIQTAAELFADYGLQMKAETFTEWKNLTVLEMEVNKAAEIRQQTARDAIEQLRGSFPMLAAYMPALSGRVAVTEELLDSFSDIERSLDILADAKGDMSLQSIVRVRGIFLNRLDASFDNNEDEFFAVVFSRMERKDYECARAAIDNPWVCKEEEDFRKVIIIFMECLEELLESQKEEILDRILNEYDSLVPQA
ncbi:MAG: hypothetical protein WCT53_01855 [Candidatus Gracilibacteria bacterium]